MNSLCLFTWVYQARSNLVAYKIGCLFGAPFYLIVINNISPSVVQNIRLVIILDNSKQIVYQYGGNGWGGVRGNGNLTGSNLPNPNLLENIIG